MITKNKQLVILILSGLLPLIVLPDLLRSASADTTIVAADASPEQAKAEQAAGQRPAAADDASRRIWWANFVRIVGSAIVAAALGWIAWIRVSQTIRRRRRIAVAAANQTSEEAAPPRRRTAVTVAGGVHAIGSIIVVIASATVLFLTGPGA